MFILIFVLCAKVNWYDMNDSIRRRCHREKATNQRDRDRDISREKEQRT